MLFGIFIPKSPRAQHQAIAFLSQTLILALPSVLLTQPPRWTECADDKAVPMTTDRGVTQETGSVEARAAGRGLRRGRTPWV